MMVKIARIKGKRIGPAIRRRVGKLLNMVRGRPGRPQDTPEVSPAQETEAVYDFAAQLKYERLPEAVVEKAKMHLLECVSWIAMGASHSASRAMTEHLSAKAKQCAPVVGPAATYFGTGEKLPLELAVFGNCALAQVHDCNDTRKKASAGAGGANHPGRYVLPVGIALAEAMTLNGRQLIELCVLGYEVASRVKGACWNHGASSAIAAMYAKANGLSKSQTCAAISLAHTSYRIPWYPAAGLDNFLEVGLVARSALEFASIGSKSHHFISMPRFGLNEGFPSYAPEMDADEFQTTFISIKPYPCCRSFHAAVDLVLDGRRELECNMEDVELVEVFLPGNNPAFSREISETTAYKAAQFSARYAIACALEDGLLTAESYSAKRIRALARAGYQRRINVRFDPDLAVSVDPERWYLRKARIRIRLKNGKLFVRSTDSPRGSHLNPLTDHELAEKFRLWTGEFYSEESKCTIQRYIKNLESLSDISELADFMSYAVQAVQVEQSPDTGALQRP